MLVVGISAPHTTRRMGEVIPARKDGVAPGTEKPVMGRDVAAFMISSYKGVGMRSPWTGMCLFIWVLVKMRQLRLVRLLR